MKKPCSSCDNAIKTRHCRKKQRYEPNIHNMECWDCEELQKYEVFRESKRRYREGKVIPDMVKFIEYISKNNFVYLRHKIQHLGWIKSLQYHFVESSVMMGVISEAIKKEDDK